MPTTVLSSSGLSFRGLVVPAALVGLILCLNGCYERRPYWLPDSTGFVFASHDTSNEVCTIFHFDLAKQTERKIVSCPNVEAAAIAIRPDGNQLAVTRLRTTESQSLATLLIYDLKGELVWESPEFVVGDGTGFVPGGMETSVTCWSPDGRHLVFGGLVQGNLGIADAESGAFSRLDGIAPLLLSGSPVAPDGSGFVASSDESLVIIDWQGREHKLAHGSEVVASMDAVQKDIHDAWWEGNTMVIPTAEGKLLVDVPRRRLRIKRDVATAKLRSEGDNSRVAFFKYGKSFLRVSELGVRGTADEQIYCIQLGDVERGVQTTLVERTSGVGLPSVSPNQQLIAVAYMPESSGSPRVAICDGNGEYRSPNNRVSTLFVYCLVVLAIAGIGMMGVVAIRQRLHLVSLAAARLLSPKALEFLRADPALRATRMYQVAALWWGVLRSVVMWSYREAKAMCLAATAQAAKVVRYAGALWHVRAAQSRLTQAKLSVGVRAWSLGLGDADTREQIADLKRRLDGEALLPSQRRLLNKELRRTLLQLAGAELANPASNLVGTAEYRSWHTANATHDAAAAECADHRAALWPKRPADVCRVVCTGGVTSLVLLLIIAITISGSVGSTRPEETPRIARSGATVTADNESAQHVEVLGSGGDLRANEQSITPQERRDLDRHESPDATVGQFPNVNHSRQDSPATSERREAKLLDAMALEAYLYSQLETTDAIERISIRDAAEALKQMGKAENDVGEPKGIGDGMLRGIIVGKGVQGLLGMAAMQSVVPTSENRRLKASIMELFDDMAKQSHERAAEALARGDNHAFLGQVGMSYTTWYVLSRESQEERDLLQSTRLSVDQRQRYAAEYATLKRQVAAFFHESFVDYAGEAWRRIDLAP